MWVVLDLQTSGGEFDGVEVVGLHRTLNEAQQFVAETKWEYGHMLIWQGPFDLPVEGNQK